MVSNAIGHMRSATFETSLRLFKNTSWTGVTFYRTTYTFAKTNDFCGSSMPAFCCWVISQQRLVASSCPLYLVHYTLPVDKHHIENQRYLRLAQNPPTYPGAHAQLPFLRSQYAPFRQSAQVSAHSGPNERDGQPIRIKFSLELYVASLNSNKN
jgi:hypothetical protein